MISKPEKESITGVWAATLRVSHIDITDAGKNIRQMSDTTRLNWYFNSSCRFMMNYVASKLSDKYYTHFLQL